MPLRHGAKQSRSDSGVVPRLCEGPPPGFLRAAREWGFALAEILTPSDRAFFGGSELAPSIDLTVAESGARTTEPAGFFPSRLPEKSAITRRNFRIAAHPAPPRLETGEMEPDVSSRAKRGISSRKRSLRGALRRSNRRRPAAGCAASSPHRQQRNSGEGGWG